MRRAVRVTPAAVLTAIVVACGGDGPDRAGFTARDSAGVKIVENVSPAWSKGDQWRLSDVPTLDIGVSEGDAAFELYRVSASRRLMDGRIVIANAGTSELRFYDRAGRFLHSTGRKGAGPGEFESVGQIFAIAPGSLMVTDRSLGRLSLFDTDGNFIRSWNPADGVRLFQPIGSFADGSVLMLAGVPTPSAGQAGVTRDTVSYYRYGPDGTVIDTLGQFPHLERYFASSGDVISVVIRPFGRHASAAVGDDVFYFGTGEEFEIAVYSMSGVLSRIQRYAKQATPLTDDHIDQYMSRQSERYRRYLEAVPFPPSLPAYSRFVLDEPGYLWVEEFLPPGVPDGRWWVFNPEGHLLGSVLMPAGFRIDQIGADYVLGTWRDEDGVEHVQSYDLLKP